MDPSMRFFLGVDGGQSSTTALIGDESGCVVGVGSGGPCNHVGAGAGRRKLESAVSTSVRYACERAGICAQEVRFEAACFGMSGGPADKEEILRTILPVDELLVTHDGVIALSGATAGNPGIIVIAGTGSLAFGRGPDSRTLRVGGWGYVFGDEGGAFDIVRQALRAALRMEEGWGAPTRLRDALLEQVGAATANEVMHRFYTDDYPRARVAGYSRMVERVAQEGDPVAGEILNQAAQSLAGFALAVREQLFPPEESALVCPVGGVFRSARILTRFRTLVEAGGTSRVEAARHGPAAGALLEAYRLRGLHPTLTNVPVLKD